MKLQPQIAALYEKLDGELYNFNRGERFLSLNQIMKKYHVHLRVVNGALDRLEKNGLITRERYVGIFSNVCRNKKIPTLLLVVPDYPSPELSGFISIIQTVFEKKPIAKLNLWRYQENDRNRIPLNRSDIVLFFGDAFPFSPTELQKLSESGKPIIFTSNEMASSQFSFINFNSISGAMIACDHLLKQGCSRLLTIRTEPLCRGIQERLTVFQTYAKLHNVSCEQLECSTHFFESASYNAKEMLINYLAENNFDFDGVFIDSYTSAESIIDVLDRIVPEKAAKIKYITFQGYGKPSEKLLSRVIMTGCSIADFEKIFLQALVQLYRKEISKFSIHLPMRIQNS